MQKLSRLKYCLVLLFFVALSFRAQAQESMMHDISLDYLQRLIDTARKYFPRVAQFDHRAIAAEENVKKAKLSWFEPLTFSYQYSPNNSSTLINNPSILNGYQFGVFVNVGSLLTKGPAVKQAKEEVIINKLQKEEYLRNLEAEVKLRYYRYVQVQTVLKVRMQAAVDAENIMKQIRYKYEKNEDSYENFNKFSIAYADRRQAAIEAEGQVLMAKSALEEMVGKKLEEIN